MGSQSLARPSGSNYPDTSFRSNIRSPGINSSGVEYYLTLARADYTLLPDQSKSIFFLSISGTRPKRIPYRASTLEKQILNLLGFCMK
jgi:hypothetical protein